MIPWLHQRKHPSVAPVGAILRINISVQSLSFDLPDNIHIRFKSDSNWECILVIGGVRVLSETTR